MDAVEILWEDEEKKRERERTVQAITHSLCEAAMAASILARQLELC
jgi:hypothetical protein